MRKTANRLRRWLYGWLPAFQVAPITINGPPQLKTIRCRDTYVLGGVVTTSRALCWPIRTEVPMPEKLLVVFPWGLRALTPIRHTEENVVNGRRQVVLITTIYPGDILKLAPGDFAVELKNVEVWYGIKEPNES